jgi:hypothetical protein
MTPYRRGGHLNEEFMNLTRLAIETLMIVYVDLATKDASRSSRSKPGVMVPVLA